MTTTVRPSDDRLRNWSHGTVAALLTAAILLGSLSTTATALGDPALVASLAAVGAGLALLAMGVTELGRRRRVASSGPPA